MILQNVSLHKQLWRNTLIISQIKKVKFNIWPFSLIFDFISRKPDIPIPYLYVDMGAAVLCSSFMSFGVKRRWFAMAASIQLALSTYASYVGEQVHYGEWLKVSLHLRICVGLLPLSRSFTYTVWCWYSVCVVKTNICYNGTTLQVRMYSRALAIIGGFLILASGAGEVYRQKARSRSLQSTGQVFLGVYLICMVSVCFGSSLKKIKWTLVNWGVGFYRQAMGD